MKKHLMLPYAQTDYDADRLIKGTFDNGESWGKLKACSIGCLALAITHKTENPHATVADFFGFPVWMAHLQESIFEGLPAPENREWHLQFAKAIDGLPDGFDWVMAYHKIMVLILEVALPHAGGNSDAVKIVMALHQAVLDGNPPDSQSLANAALAAYAAYADDAAADAADADDADKAAAYAARVAARAAKFKTIRDGVLAAMNVEVNPC